MSRDEALRESPAPALERTFRAAAARMAGLAVVNPALRVEAVGFAPWQGCWLGVVVTPWCMNLVLAPLDPVMWQPLERGDRPLVGIGVPVRRDQPARSHPEQAAGAAGATAAAAAATQGAEVILCEQNAHLLQLQRQNNTRYLHPHVYFDRFVRIPESLDTGTWQDCTIMPRIGCGA